MKATTVLFSALLLGGAAVTTQASHLSAALIGPVNLGAAGIGDFDSLTEAYETSLEEWRTKLREAKGLKERKKVRKSHPAILMWPSFETLAEQGEGRALLWMIQHVKDKGVKRKQRGPVLEPLYDRLAAQHADAEWLGEVFEQLEKDARLLSDGYQLRYCDAVLAKAKTDENQAAALFHASGVLQASDSEEDQKRAAEMRARIESKYAETSWAELLRSIKEREQSQVGGTAPDFEGRTIDGFEFKLSDYRGKVVLLDFYGFW